MDRGVPSVVRGAGEETPEHPYALVRLLPDGCGYVSGVLPYEPDGSLATGPDRAVARVLALLEERLAQAGLGLADVVRTTVYVTDLGWRDTVNAAWFAAFSPPRPARTMVEVRALPRGAPIEIDAVVHARPR
ncbi:MAG: RidA family protein [Actinobacteria bacterium]|nr:RidA family protein [Actinomycetota bacterium]